METHDVNKVMEAHASDLMKIPGVTGVAVGATEDGSPCILVLIVDSSAELEAQIPDTLDLFPVRTMVSGTIEPLEGDSGHSGH